MLLSLFSFFLSFSFLYMCVCVRSRYDTRTHGVVLYINIQRDDTTERYVLWCVEYWFCFFCIFYYDFPAVIDASEDILRSGFKSQWGNRGNTTSFSNAPSNNLVSSRDFDSVITLFSHHRYRPAEKIILTKFETKWARRRDHATEWTVWTVVLVSAE